MNKGPEEIFSQRRHPNGQQVHEEGDAGKRVQTFSYKMNKYS